VGVEQKILLSHTSDFLVKCFFAFHSARHVFFALEYMPAGDLASMIDACGCVQESAVRLYVAEVLSGMRYLHDHGVIHRDIKPSNVLIAASGHVKLADFGLCTSKSRRKQCGTLPYISPEVLFDTEVAALPTAVDLWSVGVLLYELVVGEVPFAGAELCEMRDAIARATAHGTRPFEPPSDSLSLAATRLCQGLLTYDPKQRLGVDGFDALTQMDFFRGLRWDALLKEVPPFVPELTAEDDAHYFASCGPDKQPSFAINGSALMSPALNGYPATSPHETSPRQGGSGSGGGGGGDGGGGGGGSGRGGGGSGGGSGGGGGGGGTGG